MNLKKIGLLTVLFFLMINVFAQTETSKNYKVTIYFGSFAEGVPSETPLKNFLETFKKENKLTCICADRIGPLGREGEYKLAFTLDGMPKKIADKFIKQISEVAASMKDRGQATVALDDTIIFSELSSRTTVTAEVF